VSDAAITLPAPAAGPGLRIPARLATRALGALTDARLAELAATGAGDQAFAAIYARYHQPLYRYCQSLVRDPDEAADALQSAMLKAYLALPAKRQEVELRPWLFRIVHNEAISALRRRTRHDEITDLNSPRAASAHDEAVARARLDQLVGDLQELEERQRAALVMRELSGLGYDEIATAFGTSAATAKQAVYEARVALHDLAEGRSMSCEPVRRAVSDGDGRKLRARKLRAHLRACAGCRDFEAAIGRRRADLAALAPMLPAPAAAGLLKSVLGASSGEVGKSIATLKTFAALLAVGAGAGAIGSSMLPAGHHASHALASAAQPPLAAAAIRQAPPLTSLYVLSGGQAGAPQLRPHEQLASSAPTMRPATRSDAPDPAPGAAGPAPASQPQAPGAPGASAAPAAPALGVPAPEVAVPQVPQLPLPALPVDPVATVAPVTQSLPPVPQVAVPELPPLPQAPALPALPLHLPK
jgi:RNA polymerase sigma factor (sigma-70 family)